MSRIFKTVSGILVGLILTDVAALGASIGEHRGPAKRVPVAVTITEKTCDPNELTIEAGRNAFSILNKSARAAEWEIMQGGMVIEERENIAPGATATLTTKLEPGEYDLTCGHLTNPGGKLIVTASIKSGARIKPSAADLERPIAEYMAYVYGEADAFVENVNALTAAIREGHLTKGKALSLYVAARAPFKRLEPAALPFVDAHTAIDGRGALSAKRDQTPALTGFHRLEYGLFAKHSLGDLVTVADQFDADVAAFAACFKNISSPPEQIIADAANVIERDAAMTVLGDDNRYAYTGLADIAANVESAHKIATLMRPLTGKSDPALAEQIDVRLAATEAALARHRTPEGDFISFDLLSDNDRAQLKTRLLGLAGSLSRLGGALGLG